MKQPTSVRKGDLIVLVHPETGDEILRFPCTHGRADLLFDGYLVRVVRQVVIEAIRESA